MSPGSRIGLALSGGGYRAAAFHLGVLRGLREAGVLDRVAVVSGVSGGALLAASWAARGDEPFDAWEVRVRRVLGRDLKRRVLLAALRPDRVLRLLVDPRFSLTEVLAQVLDRDLFRRATLGSLRERTPRLVVNATCLNHGTGFRFTPERIGDWILETTDRAKIDAFPLARAVAASAAFPGGFAPIVLSRETFDGPAAPREVLLTDGGVDDNFGVQPLLDCDALVVSDGSFPFAADATPLDRFGLPASRRVLLAVALALLALLGSDRFGVPGAVLVGLAVVCVLALLRLRLAVFLFGSVMMRAQRRGVLRRLFARPDDRPCVWLGLGTALDAESEQALRARGVDRARLRRVATDLDLGPADLDGLVALGEALARERAAALAGPEKRTGEVA